MAKQLYTIGYGGLANNHELVSIVRDLDATLMDVRSVVLGNRIRKGFDKLTLSVMLQDRYVWEGVELGGRRPSGDPSAEGVARIRRSLKERSVVLMCAEHDPYDCHRHSNICAHHFPKARHIFDGNIFTAASLVACSADPDPDADPKSLRSVADEIAAIRLSAI